jgi:epoxide hydrolase-like predicted phosphatase
MSVSDYQRIDGEPRGLLIDYGGVLTNPLHPVLRDFCRAKGLPEDAVSALIVDGSPLKPMMEAYERGEIEEDEFIPRFAAQLGVTPEDMDDLLVDLQPDEQMFGAVAAIRRQGVRTCLLSNSWGLALYPRELMADVFDGIVISGEVGMRKPDIDIFLHAAEVIGVEPSRCVFVDDTTANFPGAAEAGIPVIHHQAPETTLRLLEHILRVDLVAIG